MPSIGGASVASAPKKSKETAKEDKAEAKIRKEKGPKAQEHGGPKKARSAFFIFTDEKRP